ncbi:hypothetical protein B0H66DRAFT_526386 [Apodospora peruviana]|uniref:Uncharacterized protein n=1 Tax=Apodospora peruviana TaxID=516989 RepID=A0AAE0IPX9_9PEZI|nr:hypothetical protein B0H66DRAFT_526386 [Apodospora peruviana]
MSPQYVVIQALFKMSSPVYFPPCNQPIATCNPLPTYLFAMEDPSHTLVLRKTLTNSAAEFVEARAGFGILNELEGSQDKLKDLDELEDNLEFAPEIDQFASKENNIQNAEFYESSQKSRVAFSQTLRRLIAMLKERNVEAQLGIVFKDPSEFTLRYLLQIANKIQEHRENTDKTRACKNFIRSCCRKMEDNKHVVEGILSLVPSDIYGSVISGGFALIMASCKIAHSRLISQTSRPVLLDKNSQIKLYQAVERHAEKRILIQSFLADIPKKLDTIQRLSDIHFSSVELHSSSIADQTDKLTGRFHSFCDRKLSRLQRTKGKIVTTQQPSAALVPDGDPGTEQKLTVNNALAELEYQIWRFQTQVDICRDERLGRVEVHSRDARRKLIDIENHLRLKSLPFGEQIIQQTFEALFNEFYKLMTSNPQFNPRTGKKVGALPYLPHLPLLYTVAHTYTDKNTVNREEMRPLKAEQQLKVNQTRKESNKRIVSTWLGQLNNGNFRYDPKEDIDTCLKHVALLDTDDQNIYELDSWIRSRRSKMLEISLEKPPPSTFSDALSVISALLVSAVRRRNRMTKISFPVLAFFCRHRNNVSSQSERTSDAITLVESLNGQLVEFIARNRPEVDLKNALGKLAGKGSKDSLEKGLKVLSALFSGLPNGEVVFIVVDSFLWLKGREKDAEKVIKTLKRVRKKNEGRVTLKVMVTDAFSGSYVNNAADVSFDNLDGMEGFGYLDIKEVMKAILGKLDSVFVAVGGSSRQVNSSWREL